MDEQILHTMKTGHIYVLVFLVSFCPNGIQTQLSAYSSNAETLILTVGAFYDSRIRPDTTVPVTVSLRVTSLNYLDLDTGLFSVTAQFSMSWTDAAFPWNTASTPVDYIFLSNADCWRPELFIDNAANDVDLFSDRDQRMRVDSDGKVLWETSGVITVPCEVDSSTDKQSCSIGLSSIYITSEVPLSHYSQIVNIDDIPTNADWDIVETSTSSKNKLDNRGELSRTVLTFRFELEQKHSWFSIIVYLLISFLGFCVFLLPVDKGERTTFISTIILADTIIFLYIRLYEKYLTIGTFLLFLLISNILQFIMSMIVLRLHQNEQSERPVSPGIQTFTRKVLVCLSCVCCCRSKPKEDDYNRPMMHHVKFTMPKNTRVSPSKIARQRGQNDDDRVKSATSTRSISDIFTSATSGSELTSSSTTSLIEHDYGWIEIAGMLDTIFLWISLLVYISLTCIFVPILYV